MKEVIQAALTHAAQTRFDNAQRELRTITRRHFNECSGTPEERRCMIRALLDPTTTNAAGPIARLEASTTVAAELLRCRVKIEAAHKALARVQSS